MKGKLHKTEQGWVVEYAKHSELPLHPDDEHYSYAIEDSDWDGKEVEFEIVMQEETSEHYAKLIPSKEQQKQLITEIMELDAKDGLYEDDVEKLAHQYNPVMKLDAEFIRAGFKAGYNKAKETLYTEEQVREAMAKAINLKEVDDSFDYIIKSLKRIKK
jgi:seryl-tRNA synthetase